MPETKVIARVVGGLEKRNPLDLDQTINEIVEVQVNATYEDGRPGTGTMRAFPWPADAAVRPKIHEWLLQWCTENSVDYVEAKAELTAALENPRRDEPEPARDIVEEMVEQMNQVIEELGEPKGVATLIDTTPWSLNRSEFDSVVRRRALSKLTLEEQRALGLADPRRLSREEFYELAERVRADDQRESVYAAVARLMAHFDCMEETNA